MKRFKYGRPKKRNINKADLGDFLESIEFRAEKTEQLWRHVLVFGSYRSRAAVLKLASTVVTSKYTENEYRWNEAVWSVDESDRKSFVVPRNLAKGEFRGKFYFIAEKMRGELLVRDKDLGRLEEKVGQVARVVDEIRRLNFSKDCEFVKRTGKRGESGEKLWESTKEWSWRVEADVADLRKEVFRSKDSIRESVGHGDFVPKHLYDGDKIGVVDGEHAGLTGPMYYDVAQLYLHLRLDYEVSNLAELFLEKFRLLLNKREKNDFWRELKPVLIQRFMGILWGVGKDKRRLKVLMDGLGRQILEDRVI